MTRATDRATTSAMRIISFNGEYWYEDTRPFWRRAVEWVAWVGGADVNPWRDILRSPELATPISILGHRVTFQWFGVDVRTPWGFLCLHRDREGNRYAYVSRDGTPQNAHVWLHNPPATVVRAMRRAGEPAESFYARVRLAS